MNISNKLTKEKWINEQKNVLKQIISRKKTKTELNNEESLQLESNSDQNNLLLDKIKLQGLIKMLNVKSIRTAISWCKKNGIKIFDLGKIKYINLIDFQLAIDAPFIESLKIKFPKNWNEIYASYKNFDYENLVSHISPNFQVRRRNFSVQGDVANSFIKKMEANF